MKEMKATKAALERTQGQLAVHTMVSTPSSKGRPEGPMTRTSDEGARGDDTARAVYYRRCFEALARASIRGQGQTTGSSQDREAYTITQCHSACLGERIGQRREEGKGRRDGKIPIIDDTVAIFLKPQQQTDPEPIAWERAATKGDRAKPPTARSRSWRRGGKAEAGEVK